MKKLILFLSLILLFSFFILPIDNIKARSGCCSHHGGVCGCRCCDGTSLSAKCAPYYPQCGTKSIPKYEPPVPKYELPTPKEESLMPQYDLLTPEKYTAEIPKGKGDSSDGSIWWWIIGIGVVGYFCYMFGKRENN